jgi:hypothetical protein
MSKGSGCDAQQPWVAPSFHERYSGQQERGVEQEAVSNEVLMGAVGSNSHAAQCSVNHVGKQRTRRHEPKI